METFCAMESRSSASPIMTSFSQISRENIKTTSANDDRNRNSGKSEVKDDIFVNGNANNSISYRSSENVVLKKRGQQSVPNEINGNLPNNSSKERKQSITSLSNDNHEYDSVYYEYKKKGASPRMLEILEGLNSPGDCGNSTDIPEWLDRDLFNKGRQFYKDWLFCLFFSDLLSLLCMFSVSRILRALIYTRRSDTPMKALKRYVSTIMHIITWEEGDVWDPSDQAYKDLQSVRSMHNAVSGVINTKDYEKAANVPVSDKKYVNSSCPMNSFIRNDILKQMHKVSPLENEQTPVFYISQWDMAFTQYAFFGMITVHPRAMGLHYGTDEEFEALIHFWRGIGYLLGVEDKYNFCNGSLEEVRNLCLETEHLIILPHLSSVEWKYEHMCRSLIEGINNMVPHLSFPAMFRYVAETLGAKMPTFISHMTLLNTMQYWLMKLTFSVIFLIPGIVPYFNNLLKLSLDLILGRRKPPFGKLPITIKL